MSVAAIGCLGATLLLAACGGEQGTRSPTAQQPSDDVAMTIRNMDQVDSRLIALVTQVVNAGDQSSIARVRDALLALAATVDSDAWLSRYQERISQSNQRHGWNATPEQLVVQFKQWQSQNVEGVYEAMALLGGDVICVVAARDAADGRQPVRRRTAALRLAERAQCRALPERARALTVAAAEVERLRSEEAAIQARVAPVTRAVALLKKPLRECYLSALEVNPALQARGELRLQVSAAGDVTTARAAIEPADLRECVERVGKTARFEAQDKDWTAVIPLTFRAPTK